MDSLEEHQAHGCVGELVAEDLHPLLVLAEEAHPPQDDVCAGSGGKPQVGAPRLGQARESGHGGEYPEGEPEDDQGVACDAERFYHNGRVSAAGDGVVEVAAGVLEQVKHELEALGSFVIGVGDVVIAAGERAHEGGHRDDFFLSLGRGGDGAEVALVGGVHRDYEVEVLEVVGPHLAAAVGEFVAASACVDAHTVVREVADVVVARAGGVDNPFLCAALALDDGAHHALSRRAAADIAQTHEEHAHGAVLPAQFFNQSRLTRRKHIVGIHKKRIVTCIIRA